VMVEAQEGAKCGGWCRRDAKHHNLRQRHESLCSKHPYMSGMTGKKYSIRQLARQLDQCSQRLLGPVCPTSAPAVSLPPLMHPATPHLLRQGQPRRPPQLLQGDGASTTGTGAQPTPSGAAAAAAAGAAAWGRTLAGLSEWAGGFGTPSCCCCSCCRSCFALCAACKAVAGVTAGAPVTPGEDIQGAGQLRSEGVTCRSMATKNRRLVSTRSVTLPIQQL
jgi:hypothetical protein